MSPESKANLGANIQGWIRTLWPMALAIFMVFVYMKNTEKTNELANAIQDQRLTVLEACQVDLRAAVENLEEAQNATNVSIGVVNSNITTLNGNVERIIAILDDM